MDERLVNLAKSLAELNNLSIDGFKAVLIQRESEIHAQQSTKAMRLLGVGGVTTVGAMFVASAPPVIFMAALAAGAYFTGKAAFKLLKLNGSNHTNEALSQLSSELILKKNSDPLSTRASFLISDVIDNLRANFHALTSNKDTITSRLTDGTNQIRLKYTQTMLERESDPKTVPLNSNGLANMRAALESNMVTTMIQRVLGAVEVLKGTADVTAREPAIAPSQVRVTMQTAEGLATKFMRFAIADVKAEQQRLKSLSSNQPGMS